MGAKALLAPYIRSCIGLTSSICNCLSTCHYLFSNGGIDGSRGEGGGGGKWANVPPLIINALHWPIKEKLGGRTSLEGGIEKKIAKA